MSVMSDRWIRKMAREQRMIEPFTDTQVRAGVISYGLSSYGYDVRIADEFKIFTNINHTVVDPKSFDPRSFVDVKAEQCIIPPNSFALARSGTSTVTPADGAARAGWDFAAIVLGGSATGRSSGC